MQEERPDCLLGEITGTAFHKKRSQTQTHLTVLRHSTHCVYCSRLKGGGQAGWIKDIAAAWTSLGVNILTWEGSISWLEQCLEVEIGWQPKVGPPLLVQLFCLTQGRQARTFNSHTKHTHPLTFSFKPNTQTPARKGMLDLSWPEKHAFLMAPLPLLRS